jgi:4-alpha-glucanotransferase
VTFKEPLPHGYHRLTLESGGVTAETTILAAPSRAYQGDGRKLWGVFLPLYALHTATSWGAGDFTDLARLAEWTAELGGDFVATLPLLAAFLDEPCEPSPYGPASRLFWNELYLDPRRLPELANSPSTQRLLEAPELLDEIAALRAGQLVDYPRLAALKRRVLEDLCQRFFARGDEGADDFLAFVAGKPHLKDYAAFRAVGERRGEPWHCWPERLREGSLAPADFDEDDYRYHLWVQWAADRQIRGLAAHARSHGPGLYLDLPLGVHGDSYDVWRWGDLFARGASAGAPPDSLFTQGQDWGFPPIVPDRLRERGYDYLVASLAHHLEHAGILRIDHVMQLQRLYWVPAGMSAKEGVYVTYPMDELFAVLALESQRRQAVLVGENLGTVAPEITQAMERHGVLGMYVLQYELKPDDPAIRVPPAACAASLNTHDMPPFAAFWEGHDAEILAELGFFTAEQAAAEKGRRAALRSRLESELPPLERNVDGVLRRCLEHLAASPARLALVNLEDLWHETEPQNVPGTYRERPNWRRKARFTFEELVARPDIVALLSRVDALRREG